MILILQDNVHAGTPAFSAIMEYLSRRPGIETRVHEVRGAQQTLTEIYLIGDTAALDADEIADLGGVERVVRVSREYRVLGRHQDDFRPSGFEYNGVDFDQDGFELFAGLCAVDTREHVDVRSKRRARHDTGAEEHRHCCRVMDPLIHRIFGDLTMFPVGRRSHERLADLGTAIG